ncbi:MAG: hypothetical protein EBV03_09860, partial [Proteobacteria bacterium]|nr:hypothetical protein [Pseudomonadota bacterium]
MTSAIATMVINAIIIVLLVVTIGYCWLLNRRIKILQDSRGEMAQLLKHFDESTQRASESIIALQTASKKIGENIQQRMDKANYLIDDLTFMIEKGNKLANQMEASFAVGRAQARVSTAQPQPQPQSRPVERAPEPPPASKTTAAEQEADALNTVKQFFERSAFPRYELPREGEAAAPKPQAKDKPSTALGQALERVVRRGRETQVAEDDEDTQETMPAGRSRSRAEQE